VDVLSDPELFDLKVMHNASQRKQTALSRKSRERSEVHRKNIRSPKKGASNSASAEKGVRQDWRSLSNPMRVKKLRQQLEEDVKNHVKRWDAYEEIGMERPQDLLSESEPLILLQKMSIAFKIHPKEKMTTAISE
jgi:hypothetical protein